MAKKFNSVRGRDLSQQADTAMYDGGDLPDDILEGLKSSRSKGAASPELVAENKRLKSENEELSLYADHVEQAFQAGHALSFGPFQVTDVGLLVPDEPVSADDWKAVGEVLYRLETTIQLLIGDWLNCTVAGIEPGRYQAVAEEIGFEIITIRRWKSVAGSVPYEVRHPGLSWSHYRLLSTVRDANDLPDVARQKALVERIISEGLSVRDLKRVLHPPQEPDTPLVARAMHTIEKRVMSWRQQMTVESRKRLAGKLREIADRLEE